MNSTANSFLKWYLQQWTWTQSGILEVLDPKEDKSYVKGNPKNGRQTKTQPH